MNTVGKADKITAAAPLGPRLDQRRFELGSLLYLVPATVVMGVLFMAPIVFAVYLAFTNLTLTGPQALDWGFTGTTNVSRLMGDFTFWSSLWTTIIFLLGSAVIGQTVLGMILAVTMRSSYAPVSGAVGLIVVFAWILPEVTAAFIWYAFAQSGGTLGKVLGIETNVLTAAPLTIVSLANLWRGVAFSMMVFSAGLRGIPQDALDAAAIEGAGAWRRFWSVTLPLLRTTIATNLLLVTISNLSTFTLVYVMTQGGPGNATNILPVYSYTTGFIYQNLGYSTTISLALILIGGLFSGLYVMTLRERKTG